ncbi:MAG: DUF481 domain-containing protein [Halioglobus sp.]
MLGRIFFNAVLFAALVTSAGAHAQDVPEANELPLDEILLKNGSRILGTVTSVRDGVVSIDTDFAGTLSIDSATVDSMFTQGSLVLQLADGSVIRDKPIVLEQESMLVTSSSGSQTSYGMSDILLVNPEPWELGDGYKAFGLVSLALGYERGNTNTDELDYKLESYWRSLEDRYTIKMNGAIDKANGIKSADNWSILGKYDYFLEGSNYWGVKAGLQQDEFIDLDLRTYAGPYYGRQFYEQPIFTLSGELGLSYVIEDFISLEHNQEYLGAAWDAQISSNYLGGDSSMYINHVGLWNLKDLDNIILNTTFGLSFPMLGNIEGAAEIVLKYDSGAVEDVDTLDETYRFRIGYSW